MMYLSERVRERKKNLSSKKNATHGVDLEDFFLYKLEIFKPNDIFQALFAAAALLKDFT